MGVLEILEGFSGDICCVPWNYLIGVLRYLMCVVEIFVGCSLDTCSVSWRYFIGVLEILDRCPGDIWSVS